MNQSMRKNKRWTKMYLKKDKSMRKKFLNHLLENIEVFPELREQMRKAYNLYR